MAIKKASELAQLQEISAQLEQLRTTMQEMRDLLAQLVAKP
jgi:hypothetical protein